MGFSSETQKIRNKVTKYLSGPFVLDYGCGGDKVVPHALGIDMRALAGVDVVTKGVNDIYTLGSSQLSHLKGKCDAVFSAHFLEHVKEDTHMVDKWVEMLKPGGYLVLYLPEATKYDSSKNPEHLHIYHYEKFVHEFLPKFESLETIEHGCDFGFDRYSFHTVSQKQGEK